MKRLRLVGLVNGGASEFDGKYVVEYDPSAYAEDGTYQGGKLLVADDPLAARLFDDASRALEYWRQSYGLRPDGKPNRPLTAYTAEVV